MFTIVNFPKNSFLIPFLQKRTLSVQPYLNVAGLLGDNDETREPGKEIQVRWQVGGVF